LLGITNISGGEIENKGTGVACLAASTMTITDCKMSGKGKSLLYKTTNGSISCSGGLYSHNLERDFLQEGYSCIRNFDEATMEKYPYMVTLYDGIMGDANEDGFVSVADVTALISNVLEDNGCYINEKLADMDGDGSLGISDVDILINLILGKSN
nr:hypothetical protein [Prevotella sp.]